MATRILGFLVGILVSLAPVAVSARCPGGRFAIDTAAIDVPGFDAVVIEDRTVTITGCGSTRLHTGAARSGRVLRARWKECAAFTGGAILKARLDFFCSRMKGTVRLRHGGLRFSATRTPICGNGVPEGDEACDDTSACCTPQCTRVDDPACVPASCTGAAGCADGAFCAHQGACDGAGICQPRPDTCLSVIDPVCGCDGQTYANACEAARAGVNPLHRGRCGQVCGSFVGLMCPADSFCEFPTGTCGAADLPGTCRPRPDACTRQGDPVCGCDGQTYANACKAARAGANVLHAGRCEAVCGTIVGLVCPAGSFCEFPPGTCGAADLGGSCEPRPDTCTREVNPVCGCDGQTYTNDCDRQAAGVAKARGGRCRDHSGD